MPPVARCSRCSPRLMRGLAGAIARGPLRGVLGLAATAMLLVAPVTALAQTADWEDIPVTLDLADDDYFAVVSSADGTIEAQQQGTTRSSGYPAAAACDGRAGDCFTSDPDGDGSIGFFGTRAQVAAALASLRFKVNDDVALADATLNVSTSTKPTSEGTLFYNPSNGHYYEQITSTPSITWQDAETGAAARTLTVGSGDDEETLTGYLATVTDLAESAFVTDKTGADVWMGASDDYLEINEALAEALTGVTITEISETSNVVTVTTSAAHGFVVGQAVPLSGLTGTGFEDLNGVHEVTGSTETTFTFEGTGTDITAGTGGGSGTFEFADQAAADGFWFWVDGPETGQHFWSRGTFTSDTTQAKDAGPGERVNERFDAWKTGEPNGDSGAEQFGILNYSCGTPSTCTSQSNWNDFAGNNTQVDSYLVEFGPLSSEAVASSSTEVEFSIPELIPAVSVRNLALACSPDPVVPGGEVTCRVSGGDPNIDILWRASLDEPFASQGVTLDAAGAGTFTFTAPADADGRSILVELVEWSVDASVAVSGETVPSSLPAGGGTDEPPLAALAAVVVLAGALAGRMIRRRPLSV